MRYRNSLSREELMEPGKVYEVNVPLGSTALTYRKGHRIRVIVASSNYPQFEVNPNIDRKRLLGAKRKVANNRVYHDTAHPSALILPVTGDN
jgi:putative CocE/NonD family hydrolase